MDALTMDSRCSASVNLHRAKPYSFMAVEGDIQNRIDPRRRVLKGGAILCGMERSEISCTVRNLSAHGAELRLPPITVVPQEFLLYIASDQFCQRTVVRWRDGDRIGVEFLGSEPKPRWHYG